MGTSGIDLSVKWLRRWAPSGPWVVTAIDPTEGYIRTRGFTPADEPALRGFLREWRGRRGLYFQVNPDLRPVADILKKGRKEHIASVVALHVDIDGYKGDDREAGQARALQLLTEPRPGIPGPPSVVNNSGNGIHAFWLLDEPVPIDGDIGRAEQVERYNRGIAAAFGGDSTTDVSRILRLPGSINFPNAKKLALGLRPVLVRPLKFDAGLRYRLDQFPAADGPMSRPTTVSAERSASRIQIGSAVAVADLDDLKVPDRVKALIALGAHPEVKRAGRSENLFSAICAMLRCGEADEVVLGVITDDRFRISDSVLDKPDPEAHARPKSAAHMRGSPARTVSMTPPDDDIAEAAKRFEDELRSKREQERRHALDEWVWASEPMAFVRRSDHKIWNEKQWNAHYAELNPKGSISSLALRKGLVQKYETLVYEPGYPEVIGGTRYNLWRPGGIEAKQGDVQWFLDHLAYLFPDDDQAVEHVLDFMALLVREPWTKVFFALLIYGEHHGTGKSALAEVLKRMIGEHNVVTPTNEEMGGTYTAWQEGVQLAVINELMMAGRYEVANRLKNDIVDPELRIRAMWRPYYSTPNRLNFFCTTNHANALHLENADRRWLVVQTPVKPRSEQYYLELFDHVASDDDVAAVKWFLQHREVKLNPKGRAPATQAKREMQEQSLPDEDAYILSLFEEGSEPFDFDLVRREDLVDAVQRRFPGQHRGFYGRSIVLLKERLGAIKHTRNTTPGDGRPKFHLWSVRNHDRWAKVGPSARIDAYLAHRGQRVRDAIKSAEQYDEEPR